MMERQRRGKGAEREGQGSGKGRDKEGGRRGVTSRTPFTIVSIASVMPLNSFSMMVIIWVRVCVYTCVCVCVFTCVCIYVYECARACVCVWQLKPLRRRRGDSWKVR